MTTAPMSAEREPLAHRIKCWPEYFDAIARGLKTFEVRKNDRDYRAGDLLAICEWDPQTREFTGARRIMLVSYVLPGGQFGIDADYVVMGLKDE